jgi:hypothetical protein
MDQILTEAVERYRMAETKVSNPELKGQLTMIAKMLSEMQSNQDPHYLKGAASEVSNLLGAILPKASFTVRPGLTEIVSQYRSIADGAPVTTNSVLPGAPEVRLLLVRTYTVIASELETGAFAL